MVELDPEVGSVGLSEAAARAARLDVCTGSALVSASSRGFIHGLGNDGLIKLDAHIGEPYLYVGPFDGPPPGRDEFWNAPFGAVLRYRGVTSVEVPLTSSTTGASALTPPKTHPTQRSTP